RVRRPPRGRAASGRVTLRSRAWAPPVDILAGGGRSSPAHRACAIEGGGAITRAVRARLIAFWGVAGVLALLAQALVRLTPLALDAIEAGLSPVQWAVMGLWIVLNAHAEGYRGFHRRFSPRVVARARHLAAHPEPLRVL